MMVMTVMMPSVGFELFVQIPQMLCTVHSLETTTVVLPTMNGADTIAKTIVA